MLAHHKTYLSLVTFGILLSSRALQKCKEGEHESQGLPFVTSTKSKQNASGVTGRCHVAHKEVS